MKRLLFMLAAVLLLAIPVSGSIATWALAEDGLTEVRVGWLDDDSGIEGGMTAAFLQDEPQTLGVYGVYHLNALIPVPNLFDPEGEPMTATMYFGGSVTADIDADDRGSMFGPIGGLIINRFIVLSYAYRIVDNELEVVRDDEHKGGVGLVFYF